MIYALYIKRPKQMVELKLNLILHEIPCSKALWIAVLIIPKFENTLSFHFNSTKLKA